MNAEEIIKAKVYYGEHGELTSEEFDILIAADYNYALHALRYTDRSLLTDVQFDNALKIACENKYDGYYLLSEYKILKEMTLTELDYVVRKFPKEALGSVSHLLTPEQFGYCIRKEPGQALEERRARELLNVKQFDYCVRHAPDVALDGYHKVLKKLSAEQLDYCIRKDPYVAAFVPVFKLLNDDQKDYIIEKNARNVVERLSSYLNEKQKERCLEKVKGSHALQYMSQNMSKEELKTCIGNIVGDLSDSSKVKISVKALKIILEKL